MISSVCRRDLIGSVQDLQGHLQQALNDIFDFKKTFTF